MRKTSVEKAVKPVLREWSGHAPPVDVELIAQNHGVQIVRDELEDDVSGFLVRKNKKTYIGVNSKHHPNRQRFTIAHELGHFFLHLGEDDTLFVDRNIYFRNQASSQGEIKKEVEANSFAAQLLIPQSFLLEAISDMDEELDDIGIYKLANQFRVSDQAMRHRLTNEGLITSQ